MNEIQKQLIKNSLYSVFDLEGELIDYSDGLFFLLKNNKDLLSKEISNHIDFKEIARKKLEWVGIIEIDGLDEKKLCFNCLAWSFKTSENKEYVIVSKSNLTNVLKQTKLIHEETIARKSILKYLTGLVETKKYVAAFVNIDNFSLINSSYGESSGDLILNLIQKGMKKINNYRLFLAGGDQFFLIRLTPTEIENADLEIVGLKRSIANIFRFPLLVNKSIIEVRATTGLALSEPNMLFEKTFQCFKDAKSKNLEFKTCTTKEENEKLLFIEKINSAVNNDGIEIFFQPIVDNKTKKILKYEVLSRIKVENSYLVPADFMEILKKIKLYSKMTKEVLEKVYKKLEEDSEIHLSINISMDDVLDPDTKNLILKKIENSSYENNKRVTFELIESTNINDYKYFNKFSSAIRKHGVKISIDDFGVGFSNFSHLSNIEFDFLKIDGSFIKNLSNSKNRRIVESIVAFCKDNQIKVIAEYVENVYDFNDVSFLGIDCSQGYYFGKPEIQPRGENCVE